MSRSFSFGRAPKLLTVDKKSHNEVVYEAETRGASVYSHDLLAMCDLPPTYAPQIIGDKPARYNK